MASCHEINIQLKKISLRDFNKAVKEDLLGQDVREIQGLVQEVLQ